MKHLLQLSGESRERTQSVAIDWRVSHHSPTQNSCVETLSPSVVLGWCPDLMAFVSYEKRHQRACLVSPHRTQREGSCLQAKRRAHTRTHPADTLMLDFPAPKITTHCPTWTRNPHEPICCDKGQGHVQIWRLQWEPFARRGMQDRQVTGVHGRLAEKWKLWMEVGVRACWQVFQHLTDWTKEERGQTGEIQKPWALYLDLSLKPAIYLLCALGYVMNLSDAQFS